ncbi:hypothetical protein BASA81_001785 [Batrachochytrium salamandrivorans]|nr:hypothetical protein BASA81_001785 [Batrachochytrium salamandrivorans]
MLLAALAKSRALPYCCVRNSTGGGSLVFAAAVEHDPHSTHLELVVCEGQTEQPTYHGVRVFSDVEVKSIMDLAGVEFASIQAACEFMAELLVKGKFSCPFPPSPASTTAFGVTVCLGDVSFPLSGAPLTSSPGHGLRLAGIEPDGDSGQRCHHSRS